MSAVTSSSASKATESPSSLARQLYSKNFMKKENTSSRNHINSIDMKNELEMLRSELAAEKMKNSELSLNNQTLEKNLKESEHLVSALKVENEQLHQSCEKLMRETKDQITQLDHDKQDLIRKLQTAHQIITELKHVEAHLEDVDNIRQVQENLRKEQGIVEDLKKATQTLMKKQLEEETKKNGELFAWQYCEICLEAFSHIEEQTPRILGCGHTLCLGCAEKLSESNIVKCPFDRMGTQFDGKIEEALSKNYTVLNMCN